MKKRMMLAALVALGLLQTRAQAALVISEVLFNELGSNTLGEWLEIYNNGAAAFNLSSYKIGDEETPGATSTTEGMFQFPSGASILPGQVQVVAVDANVFSASYGFLPAYEVSGSNATVPNLSLYSAWDPDGTTINMSNTNDQALILDGSDAIVDAASWGSSTFAFNPALGSAGDGVSYERINPNTDTNTAADWRLGSVSSPGVVPAVPEPTTAILAAVAVMAVVRVRRAQAC
jgi:hypothetical protein